MAGAGTTLSEIIKNLTPPETATDQKQQSLFDQMASLVGKQANKAADQLSVEQSAGLPQLKQQFSEINSQILSKIAEDKALDASYQQANTTAEGKSITLESIRGEQAQNYRMYLAQKNANAAQVGLLQAQAQGLQGQVETAQNTVNRAIDLKYSTFENELAVRQAQLNALQPTLNKQEKIQAQAQQLLLDQRKEALANEKEKQKQIQNLMVEVASTGVTDQKILNRISSAKTYDDALKIATPLLGQQAAIKNQMDAASFALDTQYKQAQIANIRSEIANRGRAAQETYDPSSILAYAQQYGSTGQIPTGLPKGSFGLVAQVAKELPKQNGTIVNTMTGIKDSKTGSPIQEDLLRLYNITENAKALADLDKKRIGGLAAGVLGKVFGSNAQSEYLTKRKAIVDDIQRMQSGAALSDTEQSFYSDYLPGRFSESLFLGQDSGKKIQNFANEMNTKLQNSLKNNGLSIYGYSDVKVGDQSFKVGDIITQGERAARVNPDGSLTLIQ
jgi:hypothetical protein